MRERTQQVVAALESGVGTVDQFVFDGADVELATLLDELRSYGLLQTHKLVIVDNADKLLAPPKDGDEESKPRPRGAPKPMTRRGLFEKYAAEPADAATLLLRADTWRPGKLDKIVEQHGAVIDCKPPNERDATSWCVAPR